MENTQSQNFAGTDPSVPAMGPRPAVPTHPALRPGQAAVLAAVSALPAPATLVQLSAGTGLHVNTLREHLEHLEANDLGRRVRSEPEGRGRPAWRYEAADPAGRSEYAGLASALAAAIHETSDDPRRTALAAGRRWGRELVAEHLGAAGPGERHPGAGDAMPRGRAVAREQAVRLFEDLGFAPVADSRSAVVRLTRCPLLEAALRYPDVVCAVHLGIAQGVLDEFGGDPDRTALQPFSEPGACRLELAAARDREDA